MEVNYRYNSKFEKKKKELVEYILGKEEGTTVTYQEVGKILGFNINDELEFHRLKTHINHLKGKLVEKGCVIKTIVGIGYYILKQNQISSFCYHTYIKRTKNMLEKSANILNHVKHEELSDIRKEEYGNVCELNYETYNNIQNTIESSRYYERKEYYDSLEED